MTPYKVQMVDIENHGNVAECVRKLRMDFGRREAPSAPYVRYLKSKREKPITVRTPENIAAVPAKVRVAPSTSIHRCSQQFENIIKTNFA